MCFLKIKNSCRFIKENLKNNFLYAVLSIYVISIMFDRTTIVAGNATWSLFFKAVRYFCYIIFIINILKNWKNGEKVTKNLVLIVLLIFIVTIFSKNKVLITSFLALYSVKKLDKDKLIKFVFYTMLTAYLLIVLLAVTGVIPNWLYYRGDIIRYSLGFVYPTDCVAYYVSLLLMFIYLNYKKIKVYEIMLIEFLGYLLFYFTNARMGLIIISLLSIFLLIIRIQKFKTNYLLRNKKINKLLRLYCKYLPFILIVFLLILLFLFKFDTTIGQKINLLLSDRLRLTMDGFENFKVTLFGKNIQLTGWAGYGYIEELSENFVYNFVDISYFNILFNYGIIFLIVVLYSFSKQLLCFYKQSKYILIFIFTIILLWACVEHHLVDISYNIFLIFLLDVLDGKSINIFSYKYIKNKIINKKPVTE